MRLKQGEDDATAEDAFNYKFLGKAHFEWLDGILKMNKSPQFEAVYTYLKSETMDRDNFTVNLISNVRSKLADVKSTDSINLALLLMSTYRLHEHFDLFDLGMQYAHAK